MSRYPKTAVIMSLATLATAQSAVSSANAPLGSVISLFLLDTDPQPLVASYIGMSNSLTTLAINCPPGTADGDCGYPEPFTVTANPSTISASAVYDSITINYGCTLTGTTTGSCSVTYVGQASDLATEESAANSATGISTASTAGPLNAADITLFPITVTAGAPGGQAATASTSAASGNPVNSNAVSSASRSTNAAGGGAGSNSSPAQGGNASYSGGQNPIATYSKADAYKIAAPGMLGAALLGLAALL